MQGNSSYERFKDRKPTPKKMKPLIRKPKKQGHHHAEKNLLP
jgi:hypothetical protein